MSQPLTGTGDVTAPGGTYPLAGRPVARIGYGMGQVTRSAGDPDGRARAVTLLHLALELGINHYDTAQFYGDGLANELLRDALGDHRDDIVIVSKAGVRPVTGAPIPLAAAQQPAELRAAVEANLRSLGTDRIDVVNLRRMDFAPGLLAEGDQQVPFDDQLAEMAALRDEGKILAIGLSHITIEQLRAARPVGIACVQNIYNMVSRGDEPLLEACAADEIAWAPYFPLGGGYGSLPKVVDQDVVQQVAAELGATPSQVGLAWQLAHASNTMLIPGTGSVEHLRENTAAGGIELDATTMARLDAVRVHPAQG